MDQLWSVILAAGEGKRMNSTIPKVLHPICGRPMLNYILDSAVELTDNIVIVVGHGASRVQDIMGPKWIYVVQEQQLGTGHAVNQAMVRLPQSGKVLILCGDTPLLAAGYLRELTDRYNHHAAAVATAVVPDPSGYGRILFEENNLVKQIVEDRDASDKEKEICEINTGTYFFDLALLRKYLPLLTTDNIQKEYYLPDIINLMYRDGYSVGAFRIADYRIGLGINNRIQLAEAASIMRKQINHSLMLSGVTMDDPDTVYVDHDVRIGSDTVIRPNCIIEKGTVIGSDCRIGPGTFLSGAKIKDHSAVLQSVVIGKEIGQRQQVGPFEYIGPEKLECS